MSVEQRPIPESDVTADATPAGTEHTATAGPGAVEAQPAEETTSPQVKLVIGVLLVAAFVMILNETIMSVAIPPLMVSFDVSAATAQWLTTAFMLTMAVVIPTTGLILNRFSTRSVFIGAMSMFAAGTVLAALAPVFPVLVAGRVIQASGTAVMLPLLITTVLTFVPISRCGRTMGMISVVISVAPAVGPTFSGFILANLSWRWMFLAVLPIALVALALGAALVKNINTPKATPFDVVSILLSAIAFGSLIYGLSSIGESTEGNAVVPPALPLVVGTLALVSFVGRQMVLQRPRRLAGSAGVVCMERPTSGGLVHRPWTSTLRAVASKRTRSRCHTIRFCPRPLSGSGTNSYPKSGRVCGQTWQMHFRTRRPGIARRSRIM